MKPRQLINHDLNLLPTLDLLLKERSLSVVARQLGCTQSNVSLSLKRLREIFGDELLVRCGQSLELTTRATLLQAPLADFLQQSDLITTWFREFARDGTNRLPAAVCP